MFILAPDADLHGRIYRSSFIRSAFYLSADACITKVSARGYLHVEFRNVISLQHAYNELKIGSHMVEKSILNNLE